MAGSAADALTSAVERSKQLLFPPKVDRWFALAFTVFLAQCGESSSAPIQSPQFPGFPTSPGAGLPRGGPSPFDELGKWLQEALRTLSVEWAFYLALALGGLLVGVGLWLFILWFSSRAKLMFVETVIWERVDVSAQWTRAGELGWSLFKFRAALGLGGSLLMLLSLSVAVVVGLPDFMSGQFAGPRAVASYALAGFVSLFLGFPLLIATHILDDFVVPLMVLRNVRVSEAWGVCRREVLSGHVLGVTFFYVLKALLFVATSIATVVLACVTCCMLAIPYLNTVLLLPLLVFGRAYPLCYLEQLGISVFPAPDPSWAEYDRWRFPQ